MRPGNKINILPRLAEESYNLGAGGSGSGGSMTGRRKAFPWKKFAIGTVVFLGVVWLAGPKQRYRSYRYGETGVSLLAIAAHTH